MSFVAYWNQFDSSISATTRAQSSCYVCPTKPLVPVPSSSAITALYFSQIDAVCYSQREEDPELRLMSIRDQPCRNTSLVLSKAKMAGSRLWTLHFKNVRFATQLIWHFWIASSPIGIEKSLRYSKYVISVQDMEFGSSGFLICHWLLLHHWECHLNFYASRPTSL